MSTIAEKLTLLQNTKEDIKSAIAEKGQVISDATPFSQYADKIRNIETGTGSDTSDATATPSDILLDKTAYSADGKIVGTMPLYAGGIITPGTSNIVIPSGQYIQSDISVSGDSKLLPANIKSDVTIFGVAGTYKGTDTSDATASASDLLSGKTAYSSTGKITGTIATKTSSDLSASGATVTVPAGYYASDASKSVSTATQATPSISVSSSGLITVSATQSAGYVSSGTKSATSQLTTQSGTTITPSTSTKTAVSSGRYTTGTVYVAGSSNLVASNIKSGVNIFGVTGSYTGSAGITKAFTGASIVTCSVSGGVVTFTFSGLSSPSKILSFFIETSYVSLSSTQYNSTYVVFCSEEFESSYKAHGLIGYLSSSGSSRTVELLQVRNSGNVVKVQGRSDTITSLTLQTNIRYYGFVTYT